MTTEREQSAIKEVRDQLSLDYADQSYLNVVSSNLGINRPLFGFTDAAWRALVKILAIQHKQIRERFEAALSVLFGPKNTVPATLAVVAHAGDSTVILNDPSKLPQIGTIVFDELQATEETVAYDYIDRYTNTVYLNDELLYDHLGSVSDAVATISVDTPAGVTQIPVSTSYGFPEIGPVTVLINETPALLDSVDAVARLLVLDTGLSVDLDGQAPTPVFGHLNGAYALDSTYLALDSTRQFPNTGSVLLGASSNSFTATGGTTTSVTCAASTFTVKAHSGDMIVFEGNVTADLANVVVSVTTNNSTTMNFMTAVVSAPVAGDRFTVRPRISFTRNDYEDNILVTGRAIVDLILADETKVELLRDYTTVSLASVQVKGVYWGVIQTTPKRLEIYLPIDLQDHGDLRSASYLHTTYDSSPPTPVLDADLTPGDTSIVLDTVVGLPIVGVLTIGAENLPYYAQESILTQDGVTGDSTLVVLDSSTLPSSGDIMVGLDGTPEVQTVTANDIDTNTLTISGTLAADHRIGAVVRFVELQIPNEQTPLGAHLTGVSATLYQPRYALTSLLDGNYVTVADVFPGGYVNDLEERSPAGTIASSTVGLLVSGPTTVAISQVNGKTALEVTDASAYPIFGFPFNVVVGEGTGNREVVTLNDVNLKQRAETTIDGAHATGSTSVAVAALAGTGDNSDFPNVNGYRVVFDEGGAAHEVVYVTSASSDTLFLESATTVDHADLESVRLVSDVLSVNALADVHTGIVSRVQRTTTWPTITSLERSRAEIARLRYSSIPLVSTTGFPQEAHTLLNYASQSLVISGTLDGAVAPTDTALVLLDSSSLPQTYPYVVVLSPNTTVAERVHVSNNDTGTDTLTITHGLKYNHADGDSLEFRPGGYEVLKYDSVSGGSLRFSSPIVLDFTHQLTESAMLSSVLCDPVDTGFDFPLRVPTDVLSRIAYIFDLLRAAGVKVTIILKR